MQTFVSDAAVIGVRRAVQLCRGQGARSRSATPQACFSAARRTPTRR
jgi:hypothetical protein